MAALLALLWTWMAVAYHFAFFTAVNPAAWAFGAAFLAGAAAFLYKPVRFEWNATGAVVTMLGLVVYPLANLALGHAYPRVPTFGAPCPTSIFTLGMLCFARPPLPRLAFVVPLAWAGVASSAAFLLGVPQDLLLLVAAAACLAPRPRARAP